MKTAPERYEFASDNTAPICPEAWTALKEANSGAAVSYGDDRWTFQVRERVREIFEADCDVFFVFNGTAANALALAQLCQSFYSVICHKQSHIQTDECGAPEFFTKGSKLLTIGGSNGKINLSEAETIITQQGGVHSHRPRVISITQATEFGTVYTRDEVAVIAQLAHRHKMFVHMDGARFANAVATLQCAPKAISWQAGVDVLCFGGIKNGVGAGELVVFFQNELSREFDYRVKQAGHLASKMRFLAGPWMGLLTDDVWLRNAKNSNRAARNLAQRLQDDAAMEILFPVQANAVFLRMSERQVRALQDRGWQFYKFIEPDVYRLMCSWSTTEEEMDDFVADVRECATSLKTPVRKASN